MNKRIKKAVLCIFAYLLTASALKSETAIQNTTSSAETKSNYICSTYDNTDDVSKEDIELIALLTMAEAESESEKGKRLVIDTVLNRVDSEHFPDTIYDVIYQPKQFSPIWNGRIERCYVSDDICELVKEEMENRTDSDVIFFTAGGYSKYGEPLYKVGNHYFSSYE